MKRKLLLKNILGAISLLVFTAIVSIIILQLPSAYISNGIWQGNFDINGKGKHDLTALYMNGKVVNNSDDWSMYIPIVRNDDTRLIDKNKTWGGPPGPAL